MGVGTFVYLTYIADQTYDDDRISVTVPAQTNFNISASKDDKWTFVRYNSSDDNNITIDLMKPSDNELNLYDASKKVLRKSLTEGSNYTELIVSDNYTIYYDKEKKRYATFIFDDHKKVVVLICCDNSRELIEILAKSFVLKEFNTIGLNVVDVGNNSTNSGYIGENKAISIMKSFSPDGAPSASAVLTTFMGRPMYKVSWENNNYAFVDAVTGTVYDKFGTRADTFRYPEEDNYYGEYYDDDLDY